MITIKELHGDSFESTELIINYADDPDAVCVSKLDFMLLGAKIVDFLPHLIWISKVDFMLLGAKLSDFRSRTFFIYYGDEERRRIVTPDPELRKGQVRLNRQDLEDFAKYGKIELFKPYPLLLEHHLIVEELNGDRITKLMIHVARKFFRKLVLFYYFMESDCDHNFIMKYNNPVDALFYMDELNAEIVEKGLIKPDNLQEYMVETMFLFYTCVKQYPSSLGLPLKAPDTILQVEYEHWEELRNLRENYLRINDGRISLVDEIVEIWKNELAPIIEQWENEL